MSSPTEYSEENCNKCVGYWKDYNCPTCDLRPPEDFSRYIKQLEAMNLAKGKMIERLESEIEMLTKPECRTLDITITCPHDKCPWAMPFDEKCVECGEIGVCKQ